MTDKGGARFQKHRPFAGGRNKPRADKPVPNVLIGEGALS
jgi:hypothetical protein